MNMKVRKHIGITALALMAFILVWLPLSAATGLTADKVVMKAAAVVTNAKGIEASFTITANGRSARGVLKSSGQKFSVILPQVSSWYNGSLLYTYNPRTSETTLTKPTAQELLETNPLLYVKGSAGGYTYSFSPVKRNGKYVVDLKPKNKRSGLRKLTFTINASTFRTERIVVDAGSGVSTVDVTSFKSGVSFPASAFEYPKAKYPKAEIVDLR